MRAKACGWSERGLQVSPASVDKALAHPPLEEEVLRIDETSKTLVAPQAGGLVTEAAPEREELLSLVGASWEAFAQELGLPNLKFVAAEPVPGVDILAFDEVARKTVVVQVTGETVEWQLA